MSQIKIAAVSYLNSIAFTYGITNSELIDADLRVATPVECTELLRSKEVDVALIPVAAIPSLGDDYQIVTSHCIGASAEVRTVVLMSDEEPEQIKRIWLDTHSQTSVKLLAHLAEHHFKISPKWLLLKDMERVEHPQDGDAFLLIGDKVFDYEGLFDYNYDLAEEWIKHSGLPFVFAAWCTHNDTPEEVIADLEDALTWGVEHTFEALTTLRPEIDIEDGYRYLTENIDTLFDGKKSEAMNKFWASSSRITIDTKE